MSLFEEFVVAVGEGAVGAIFALPGLLPVFANLHTQLVRNSNLPQF